MANERPLVTLYCVTYSNQSCNNDLITQIRLGGRGGGGDKQREVEQEGEDNKKGGEKRQRQE